MTWRVICRSLDYAFKIAMNKTSFKNFLNVFLAENILNPPKTVVTNVIFLQLIFLVMYGHHILDFFACFDYI